MMRNLLLLLLPTASWAAYDWHCNLYCYNGGTCKSGKGKFGSYAGVGEDEELPWQKTAPIVSGAYCSCPVGFTGLQCEIKLKVCTADGGAEDTHTCFNGSECVSERSGDGKQYFRCECDPEGSIMEAAYAGKYCEHIATTFCGKRPGDSSSSTSFCTNGGKCKDKTDPNQKFVGCICPTGWEGPHCEKQITTLTVANVAHAATSKTAVAWSVGLICAVAFITTGVLAYREHKKKKRSRKERLANANIHHSFRASESYRNRSSQSWRSQGTDPTPYEEQGTYADEGTYAEDTYGGDHYAEEGTYDDNSTLPTHKTGEYI